MHPAWQTRLQTICVPPYAAGSKGGKANESILWNARLQLCHSMYDLQRWLAVRKESI